VIEVGGLHRECGVDALPREFRVGGQPRECGVGGEQLLIEYTFTDSYLATVI